MAKLSMKQRKALPKSDFAVPSKAPGPGSFPMPDKAHEVAAKRLAGRVGPSAKKAVAKKAKSKFGDISTKLGMPMNGTGNTKPKMTTGKAKMKRPAFSHVAF